MTMQRLSISGQTVAEVQVEHIELRRLIGAYELIVRIQGSSVIDPGASHWIMLHGAQMYMWVQGKPKQSLGIARPDRPERIATSDTSLTVSAELKLTLQPHQIAAIEDYCDAQDLHFDIVVVGSGNGPALRGQFTPTVDQLSKEIARSEWIRKLRDAGALDIVVIEVPMPVAEPPEKLRALVDHLRRAQKMFLDGNYPECVAHCRDVMDLVDKTKGAVQHYAEALKKLSIAEDRKAMLKAEREIALLAAVRHYTHLAHHSDNPSEYITPSEAKMILALSATLVARKFHDV